MRNLIIFGDTPFAERLFKYISIEGKDKVVAFTQERNFISNSELQGLKVLPFEELDDFVSDFEIVLGIGYTKMNQLKKKVYDLCKSRGYKIATYISTNAIVYTGDLQDGCFIAPGAVIGPGCKLGKGNYLESSVVLSHDNEMGDFNFLSTNAVFGGFSKVEDNCFFGLHSTVKDGVFIASNNLFGSAVNILKSINFPGGVFVGNPARQLVGKESETTKI